MSDRLQGLKTQGKISMQNLVNRALVQDQVSMYKRGLFKRAYSSWISLISIPFAILFLYKSIEVGDLHHNHSSLLQFFYWGKLSIREMHAPEIYEKENRLKLYESNQFR